MKFILILFLAANKIYNKQHVKCIKVDYVDADTAEQVTNGTASDDTRDTLPDDEWTTMALKDIAYYLRSYKFNGWDQRSFQDGYLQVTESSRGFYRSFPDPPLRTLYWSVQKNCDSSFYKCIQYLYSVIIMASLTRSADTIIFLNENPHYSVNDNYVKKIDANCKQLLVIEEMNSSPFESTFEKFQWRTSACYYMCYYTMLGTPALSMLGEPCDNFANCLDPVYGTHNMDVRADDRLSFACATYSFCPDPCCPLKHTKTNTDCFQHNDNPCFMENHKGSAKDRACHMDRKSNQNVKDIIENKWNISCNCKEDGFEWKPQFGICVDVNECVTGNHACLKTSEDCSNLPGSYHCICKWGFSFQEASMKCIKSEKIQSMFSGQ